MRLSGFLLSLALVMLALGCSSTSTLAPPRVELTGITALSSAANNQRFRVSLLLTNPNAEPLPIEKLQFSVRLAGEGRLEGDSGALTVAPQNTETLSVEVPGDLVSSLSRLLSLLQGPESGLPYELVGQVTLARARQNYVPFNSTGQVPLSTPAAR
jgi:LEA14-like dessication related protein